MTVNVYHAKSFTKDPDQGTPTGIVLDATDLSDKMLLDIAKKLKYSESAFIQKSKKATYKIRFFAPEKEVALCAHATLAAFHTLVETGRLKLVEKNGLSATQETLLGVLPVTGYNDGLIVMTQKDPTFFPPEVDRKLVANLLAINLDDLVNQPIETVSTGTPKLIVPVASLAILRKIKPDFEAIKDYCRKTDAKGIYVYTSEIIEKGSDFHARQFNPLAGINEDPITGVAAGALGSYIKKYNLLKKNRFVVEQGYIMNKAGKIIVDVSDGVKVGGYILNIRKDIVEV